MTALWVQHEVTTSPLHSAHAISPRSLFDPVVRELKKCRLRTFCSCKLHRDCWEKVIMKAAEATAKRLEKRTWKVPSVMVWLIQRSGLSQQKQNTLEGSSKKRTVDALDYGRQTGEEYLVSHTVKNLELEQTTATWGSGIHHPNCCWPLIKAERNGWRTVSFLQNYLEETNFHPEAKSKYRDGPREDRCRANERWASHREDDLRNFDAETIHTIQEHLEQRLTVQSNSRTFLPAILLEQRTTTSPRW